MYRNKSQKVVQTILECPRCKNRVYIWRRKAKQRGIGHIKTMWCPHCKKSVRFVETRELTTQGWMSLDGEIIIK